MPWVDCEEVAFTYQEGRSSIARPEDWGRLIELPGTDCPRALDLGAGNRDLHASLACQGSGVCGGPRPLSFYARRGAPSRVATSLSRGRPSCRKTCPSPARAASDGCHTSQARSAPSPRFPSIEDVAHLFSEVGFGLANVDEVRQPPTRIEDVRAWITKMRHADTLLTALTDNEVATGLSVLDASGAMEPEGSLHLLTLSRGSQI